MNRTLLFVYGTLRPGERNHHFLHGAELVGPARTAAAHRLVSLGRYPALLEGGATAVLGELYRVDREMLAVLDDLEGHPHLFVRTSLELEGDVVADAYLLPLDRCGAGVEIPSGDWRDRPAQSS